MPRRLDAYCEEILKSIDDIKNFVKNHDFESYSHDEKTKAAVERKLLNIGEALNQAGQEQNDLKSKITGFRRIVDFRNVLVHGYFGVDDALVWDVISNHLDLLQQEVQKLR